jgi:hypothetical protein
MLRRWHRSVAAPRRAAGQLAMTCVLLVAPACQADPARPSPEITSPATSAAPTRAPTPRSDADFDADVALGGGLTEVDDIDDGVVLVVYGSSSGLMSNRTQAWS